MLARVSNIYVLYARARAIIIWHTVESAIWGQWPFILISANLINNTAVLFNYTPPRYSMQSPVALRLPRDAEIPGAWNEEACEEGNTPYRERLMTSFFFRSLSVPAPEHKKATDYISGLFRVEATLQPRPRRRLSLEESTTSCGEDADDKKWVFFNWCSLN